MIFGKLWHALKAQINKLANVFWTADPVAQMERVYKELDLGGFDEVLPALQKRVAASAGYKPNRHQLDPELREAVGRRWAGYFEKYGYPR